MLPALAIYALFVLYPLGHAAWMSLFAWDGLLPPVWVGLDNYREIFEDPALRGAFMHSLVLIAFYSVLPVTIGLVLAAALSRRRVRGLTAFRTLLFLPQVVAMVVVAVIWRWMYSPASGPVNQLLGALQLDWLQAGLARRLHLGAAGGRTDRHLGDVRALPGALPVGRRRRSTARCTRRRRIDGAGAVREFFAVTLPGPAQRARGRADADHDRRAAHLRPDLHHHPGRAGRLDLGARRSRSTTGPSRRGQIGSAAAIGITLTLIIFVLSVGITPDRGDALVNARRIDATLNYALLLLFTAIAVVPIIGILLERLRPARQRSRPASACPTT